MCQLQALVLTSQSTDMRSYDLLLQGTDEQKDTRPMLFSCIFGGNHFLR